MATLHNAESVKSLLRNRGNEEGLRWRLIYAYENAANGEKAFAIFNEPQYDDMYQSPYVRNPVLLMCDGTITLEGAEFLGVVQEEFNEDEDEGEDPFFAEPCCPNCGSDNIETVEQNTEFEAYGEKISVENVPVRRCNDCEQEWTDNEGAAIMDQAMFRYEKSHGMIRTKFADEDERMGASMTHLEELMRKPGFRKGFNEEALYLEVTEALCKSVDDKVADQEVGEKNHLPHLVEKLGLKKKKVKKMLEGRISRMTLKQLADIATKLGCEVKVEFVPQKVE